MDSTNGTSSFSSYDKLEELKKTNYGSGTIENKMLTGSNQTSNVDPEAAGRCRGQGRAPGDEERKSEAAKKDNTSSAEAQLQ
jgi:hypothetical protein